MILLEEFKDGWNDARDIYLVSVGIRQLAKNADFFSDIFSIISILLPFLSSRKNSDPVNLARKQLRELRKDLKKKRIGQSEYDLLRAKVLEKLASETF